MTRRQVARGVGEAIVRRATGEAAERLFDDLYDRLDAMDAEGLDRPAEAVIAAICRDLGLEAVPEALRAAREAGGPVDGGDRPDG